MAKEFEHKPEKPKKQQEADKLCGVLYEYAGMLVDNHGESHTPKFPSLRAFGIGITSKDLYRSYLNPNLLSISEQVRKANLSGAVDLGEEGIKGVELAALGGKTPLDAERTFIFLEGSPEAIALQKDGGQLFERNDTGKFLYKGEVTPEKAEFYKNVLLRFEPPAEK
jgi:hypothetical protein